MNGAHSSYDEHVRASQAPEVYLNVENTGLIGQREDLEGKEAINIRDKPSEFEDKPIISCQGNTDEFRENENDGIQSNLYKLLSEPPSKYSISRMRHTRWCKALCIVAVLIIVLTSILVGVLVSRNRDSKSLAPAPAISSSYVLVPSAVPTSGFQGALRGTRLTAMDQDTGGNICLFYQYADGSLRYQFQNLARVWQGSTDLQVKDAMQGTPLAAVSTWNNGSVIWWLFYVDKNDTIQNIYSQFDTTKWQRGTVGVNGYKVPNRTNIAFTVSRGISFNDTTHDLGGGLNLYASNTDGTIQEYTFNAQDGIWSNGFTFFNTDGYSGATLYSVHGNAFLYALNSDQDLAYWWRDYNTRPGSQNNSWHLGTSSQDSVSQNVSMCAQFLIAFQSSDGWIRGSNFSASAEPGDTRWGTEFVVSNQTAIDGSAVSCWYFYPQMAPSDRLMFQVFYQIEGNQIADARKHYGSNSSDMSANWTYSFVPI